MPRKIIRIQIILALFLFPLLWGCEQEEKPPPEPVKVRKTIAVEKSGPVKAPKPAEAPAPAAPPAEEKTVAAPPADKAPAQAAKQAPAAPEPRPQPAGARGKTPEKAPRAPVASLPAPGKTQAGLPPEAAPADAALHPAPAVRTYDPEGRIDPFAPLFAPTDTAEAAPRKKKRKRQPLTPLEKLDLSQLKLVAVIRTPKENRALVEETTGKGYVVTKGTYMGRNSGVVVAILKDRIIVEEEIEGFTGKISLEKRELKLEKPPGDF